MLLRSTVTREYPKDNGVQDIKSTALEDECFNSRRLLQFIPTYFT